MKACNDLEFLNSYWKEAKDIGYKIIKELPKTIGTQAISKSNTGLLCFVKYSDIENSWSVKNLLSKVYGESPTLAVLSDKIFHMILLGRANDIKPMVEKICTGRLKTLTKKVSKHSENKKHISPTYHNEFLGKGHFRWNNQAYTLNEKEIKHLKEYFKL